MDFLTDWLTDWLKELLIGGIMGNLVKGDKKVKKVIVVFGVGVIIICMFAIAVSILA